MSQQHRRNSRNRVIYDSPESSSDTGGTESTSDEEYGFHGGMGYGGYSEAAREGYFAGYYWETSSDGAESHETSPSNESESVQRSRRRRRLRVSLSHSER
jgi:hypothetical protein